MFVNFKIIFTTFAIHRGKRECHCNAFGQRTEVFKKRTRYETRKRIHVRAFAFVSSIISLS